MSYGGYNNQGYDSYDQPGGGRYNNYSQGPYDDPSALEMQPYGADNPTTVLNEISEIKRAIREIDGQLNDLERTFKHALMNPDTPASNISSLSSRITTSERALLNRTKNLKAKPGASRFNAQIESVQKTIENQLQRYREIENQFQRDSRAAAERQYRIVRPDATEQEVQDATADPNSNIFQQALAKSSRSGQAQSTLNNVRERHEAIQNIARQMEELAQLFQELETMVVQQGEMVTNIEQKGEEVHDNVVKANTEIGGAIEKARSRNRKKWWCVLIIILIIIVIIIVALVAYFVTKK